MYNHKMQQKEATWLNKKKHNPRKGFNQCLTRAILRQEPQAEWGHVSEKSKSSLPKLNVLKTCVVFHFPIRLGKIFNSRPVH